MMTRKTQAALVLSAFVLVLAGCSKSFDNGSSSVTGVTGAPAASSGTGSNAGTENTAPAVSPQWRAINAQLSGKLDGSTFNGLPLLQVDPQNQAVVVYIPIPISPNIFLPITSIDIPELPGLSIFQAHLADGSSEIAVRVPLKYLLGGAVLSNANYLPNGDALPFMPTGQNIGFSVSIPQAANLKLDFYLAQNAVAIFVELPVIVLPDFWSMLSLGFPIRSPDGSQVLGYFAFIPNKASAPSGVYVAARIPDDIANLISTLIKF